MITEEFLRELMAAYTEEVVAALKEKRAYSIIEKVGRDELEPLASADGTRVRRVRANGAVRITITVGEPHELPAAMELEC
jgi:hypothetical protein